MKKICSAIVLFFTVITCLFAGAFTKNISDFEIKFLSISPLYKPYFADSWSVSTRAQFINLIEPKGIYQTLACTRYEEGRESEYFRYETVKPEQREDFIMEIVDFRNKEEAIYQLYRVKTGFSFSALQISYKDIISTELCVQGALNLVFDANGGTDCLGFDGVYFYGANASFYNDLISFRIGKHHYSGHYGDEIEESFMLRSDNSGRMYAQRFSFDRTEPGYISRLVQYVRQDSLVIGVSAQPTPWLRIYGELDCIPGKIHRYRPWLLDPDNMVSDDAPRGVNLEQAIGVSEGVYAEDYSQSRKVPYDSIYRGMTVETGVEFTLPVRNILDIRLAFDCKMFQEGITGFQIGSFDKNNKWDVDYNVLLGINIPDSPVCAELMYHKGRFPLTNFFWQQCSYWSAGFSLSY